jgi:hypothetical protein
MYDTIDFYLKKEHAKDVDFLAQIPMYLSNTSEHYFNNSKTVSISGTVENLKINVSENKVKIINQSLCKWYLGNNFKTLQRKDVQNAVQKISDLLHVPFEHSNITRIDIANNFILKYPETVYFEYLGNLNHYNRLEQKNGLYYNQNDKQLVFYGKIIEQKDKRQIIPETYQNRNVLRYEMRFKNRLANEFNQTEIKASDLYNEKFYENIIDVYKKNYFNISKIKQLNLNFENMENAKNFKEYFYLLGLKQTFGNEVEAVKLIEVLSKKGLFENRTQKSRLKDEIKKAFNLPNITTSSEPILELDKKVKEACNFYR